ncbi:hypothetical protein BGZ98_004672 [Dissophora globulifera]|nr:hypothetical protein BGZ98_004672 [Dissophora globulifera]
MVKMWASQQQNDSAFVQAAGEVVIEKGKAELDKLGKVKELQHPANAIDLDKIQDFKLKVIEQHFQQFAPVILRVITGLATVNALKEASSTITTICSMLLFLRNQWSNHFQMMVGLYLYSCGCPSAVMDTLSKAAMSKGMTEAALSKIRQDVLCKPWFLVYDNINFARRKLDQRVNNADSFESGTTATIIMMDNYITSGDIRSSYKQLNIRDLIPDKVSTQRLRAVTEKALVDVLVRASDVYRSSRRTTLSLNPLALAETITQPLPSMCIDQSSLVGNLEVITTVMEKSLRLSPEWFDAERKIVVAGDQLTVSRISTAAIYKAVDVSPYHRLQYALLMLQLFHLKMTLCSLILQTHWGSTKQTGSLQFNKELLRRKHVSQTDFDYHAADELLRHTFEAMVRRIWEVALGSTNLTQVVEDLDDQQRENLVSSKVADHLRKFFPASAVDLDRLAPLNRNAVLFLRDMIKYLELCDAIKTGDVGRVEESLKWVTIMLQSGSNNNYGSELLHIHCALRYVWLDDEMKTRIMSTWLVNTKGKENGWIPTDLYQEYNNGLIKAVYDKAIRNML